MLFTPSSKQTEKQIKRKSINENDEGKWLTYLPNLDQHLFKFLFNIDEGVQLSYVFIIHMRCEVPIIQDNYKYNEQQAEIMSQNFIYCIPI